MLNPLNPPSSSHRFTTFWIITAAFVISPVIYIALCHILGAEIQSAISLEQRVLMRSIFYALAIATFPLTTLIRHIFVRLNQTMPGTQPAQQRYLTTLLVSFALMETVGLYGLIMFVLGDDFNTLYIVSGLAVLGFFLHRPKQDEYQSIVEALEKR